MQAGMSNAETLSQYKESVQSYSDNYEYDIVDESGEYLPDKYSEYLQRDPVEEVHG